MASVVDQLFNKQATPSATPTTTPSGGGSVVNQLFGSPTPTPTATPTATPTQQPIIAQPQGQNIFQKVGAGVSGLVSQVKNLQAVGQAEIDKAGTTPGYNPYQGTPLEGAGKLGSDITNFLGKARDWLGKEIGRIQLVTPAYAPDKETVGKPQVTTTGEVVQNKPIETLVKEYKSTPLYEANKKTNLFLGNMVQGLTGGIIKPEMIEAPTTTSDKITSVLGSTLGSVYTLGKIGGTFEKFIAGSETVGSFITQFPKVAKWVIPALKTTATFDIYGQLDPDIENRFQKIAQDSITAVPYAMLGFIGKARYSIPASFGLGFGLAKLEGASNEDAIINGSILAVLDGAGRFKNSGNINQQITERVIKQESADTLSKYSGMKVTEKSSLDEIKRAYRKASLENHPDRGGSSEAMSAINSAYEFLTGKGIKATEKITATEKANPEIQKLLPAGEYQPQEVINKVVGSPVQNTEAGKLAIKEAVTAQQEGRTIAVTKEGAITKPKKPELKVETSKPKTKAEIAKELETVTVNPEIAKKVVEGKQVSGLPEAEYSGGKNLIVKEGDYIVDRNGRLKIVVSGNDKYVGDSINEGSLRSSIIGAEPHIYEGKEIGYMDYANQIRMATPEEIAKAGLETPSKTAEVEEVKPTTPQETSASTILERQVGKTFEVVEPVSGLWESKGNILHIRPLRQNIGFADKLRQNVLVESVQEAGGNNVYKVVLKPEAGVTTVTPKKKAKTSELGKQIFSNSVPKETVSKMTVEEYVKAGMDYYHSLPETEQSMMDGGMKSVLREQYRNQVAEKPAEPKKEVAPSEPKTPENETVYKYLMINFGKDLNNATGKQLLEAIERAGDGGETLDYTPQLEKKISSPAKGIDKSLYQRPALVYGGKSKGVFTDGYILIVDKKMAESVNNDILEKEVSTMTKDFQKNGAESYAEANKLAKEKVDELVKEYSKDEVYPPYEKILPQEKGSLLTPKIIGATAGEGIVVFDGVEVPVNLNANKIALFKKYFPEAKFYSEGGLKPVQVYNGSERVGLTMPIRMETPYSLSPSKVSKPSSKIQASFGDYETSLENITESTKEFKVIPFPEMVRLAETLMNKVPSVKMPRARMGAVPRGLFTPTMGGSITLNPEIFKNIKQASFTLAHEMGHLTDYLPDSTMSRGNLLGRIGTLRKFLRSTFSGIAEETKIQEFMDKRASLRDERRSLKDENGKTTDKALDSSLLKQIKTLNKDIKAIRAKGAIKNEDIKKELWELSKKWRPLGEKPSAEFLAYRKSPEELYADSISVLFNDPARLKQEAPIFFESFFKYLDQKPKVKKEFFEIQDLLNKSDEEIMNVRLQELDKDYSKGEDTWLAKEEEARNQKENMVNMLSTMFNDQNQEVNARVNKYIRQGGIIDPKVNPTLDLAGLNYLEGKVKNFIADNYQPALTIAKDVPNGWSELGKILQLERAIYERGELANPRGYDPIEAQKTLDALEKKLGAEDWQKLQKAKDTFRQATQALITEAETAGFYKPELIAQMKANPAYATFQVLDYLDTKVSSSILHQKGTLKAIANPATSTVMKAVTTLRAIRYNKSKDINIKFLEKANPDEITPAKKRFTGKRQEILPPKDKNLDLVTVIRDGKMEGFYVPKEVADVINHTSEPTLRTLGKISRKLTQARLYRPLFTSLNLGFQLFNFGKDFDRSWRNLPDKTLGEALTSFFKLGAEYGKAVGPSWRRATGQPDELIKQLENSELLGLTRNDLYGTPDPEVDQIARVLQKVGALPVETQPTTFQKLTKPVVKLFDGIEVLGNFIETLPKVAGYELVKDKMPSPEETIFYVRNYIGSPDFRVSGKATPITNNIFLFSNAMKEGIKGDINMAFKRPQTKSAWWFKMGMGTVLPKLLQLAVAMGLFGTALKKLMDGVSEYDKTNYDIIILGQDENGKTIYIRKPKDESGRFVGALIWKFANTLSSKDKQSLLENLSDIFALWSGQLPSVAPSITGFQATLTYLSGKNPYDAFRNRFVIPDTQFKAGFKYSFPIFLDWLSKNQGLNIITPSYTPEGQLTALEKVLNFPVLSNILGRFVKVSDYGLTEQSNKLGADIAQESAIVSSEKKIKIKEAVNAFTKSKDQSEEARGKAIDKLIVDVLGHEISTKEENTTAKDITKRFNMGLITNEYSASVDNIVTANTNEEKAQMLKYLYDNDRETYDKVNQRLIDEGVVTKDTYNKFEQLIMDSENKKQSSLIDALKEANPFKPKEAMASDEIGFGMSQDQRKKVDYIDAEIPKLEEIIKKRQASKLLSPQPISVLSDRIKMLKDKRAEIIDESQHRTGVATYYDPMDPNQTKDNPDGIGAYGRPARSGSIAFGNRMFEDRLKKGEKIYIKVKGWENVETPYGKGIFRIDDTMNKRYNKPDLYKIDFVKEDIAQIKEKTGKAGLFNIKFKIVEGPKSPDWSVTYR